MTPAAALTPEELFEAAGKAHTEKRYDEALAGYLELLALHPDDPRLLRNLGHIHADRGEWTQAVGAFRLALGYEPLHAGAWIMFGAALGYVGEHERSGEAYERAMSLTPDAPGLRWNRSLWLLAEGRWREGWDEYRWGVVRGARRIRTLKPEWDGSRIPGRTLWVWAEQGLGDAIMFSRFLAEAQARSEAHRIVFEVHQPLVSLFVSQGWPVEVIELQTDGAMPGGFDEHVCLMSLPRVLEIDDPADVETPGPYLAPPHFEPRTDDRFRVGLCWAGSTGHPNDRARSLDPALLEPLSSVPRVEWVSLQAGKEPPAWCGPAFEPRDWLHTCSVVAGLDLVITADTSVAHAAGAMGVPVWIMLPFAGDFRWLRHTDDTPWYRSARLFRQPGLGQWGAVIERVRQELARKAHGRAAEAMNLNDEGERGWSEPAPFPQPVKGAI